MHLSRRFYCEYRDIRHLGEFTQLKEIVLDVNELFEDSVRDLPVMPSVVSLYLNDNEVRRQLSIYFHFSSSIRFRIVSAAGLFAKGGRPSALINEQPIFIFCAQTRQPYQFSLTEFVLTRVSRAVQIQDLDRFLQNCRERFPNLATLSLLKNPCCPNPFVEEQKDKYRQYRSFVVSKLSKLNYLDRKEVSDLEREHVAVSRHTLSVPAITPRGVMSPLTV